MDVRNGHIYSAEEVLAMSPADRQFMKPMATDPTPAQLQRGRVGRNDPCPCGSGKKFKKCCLVQMTGPRRNPAQEREYAASIAAEEAATATMAAIKVIPPGE